MPAPSVHRPATAATGLGRWVSGPWAPVVLGAVCFINVLGNEFVRDDIYVISQNPRIRSLLNWRGIWLSNWWELAAGQDDLPPAAPDRLYRPFTLFTFALNYAVGGLRPIGYFAVNVLLHALVCGLVWRLGLRLTGDRRVAVFAAILFAVHPIHSEAVANAVGRADLLAALFVASGMLMLLPEGRAPSVRRGLCAAGLFCVALLSKESAACYVGLALILLALRWSEVPTPRRVAWAGLHTAQLALPLAAYLPLRHAVLGSIAQSGVSDVMVNPLIGTGVVERLVGALQIAGYYARAVVFPVWLSHDYGLAVVDPRAGFTPIAAFGALSAVGVTVALAGWLRPEGVWRRLGVCAALFVVSYALISNTVLLIGTSLGERLFYWPSAVLLIGVGLIAVSVHDTLQLRSANPGRAILALGGVAAVLLAARTVVRNSDWRDGAALVAADLANWPRSAQLQASQAWYLANAVVLNRTRPDAANMLERAQWHVEESLRICPTNVNAERILVEILLNRGDAPGALAAARRIVARHPEDWHAHANLTMLLADTDPAAALHHAREAYRLEPRALQTRANLAQALVDNGAFGEALEVLRVLERDLPTDHQLRPQVCGMIRQLEQRGP